MSDQIVVTLEAAQDFRALVSNMTDDQVQRFLQNSIAANDATRLTVLKEVQNVKGHLVEEFTLKFLKQANLSS